MMCLRNMLMFPVVIVGLIGLASCQSQSMGSVRALSAAALSEEYERSRAEVRRKYDGKEITIAGYATSTATVPTQEGDQGAVALGEKGTSSRPMVCWFTRDQISDFSKINAGQYLIVKGVFSGEAGPELKFCKLAKASD